MVGLLGRSGVVGRVRGHLPAERDLERSSSADLDGDGSLRRGGRLLTSTHRLDLHGQGEQITWIYLSRGVTGENILPLTFILNIFILPLFSNCFLSPKSHLFSLFSHQFSTCSSFVSLIFPVFTCFFAVYPCFSPFLPFLLLFLLFSFH